MLVIEYSKFIIYYVLGTVPGVLLTLIFKILTINSEGEFIFMYLYLQRLDQNHLAISREGGI